MVILIFIGGEIVELLGDFINFYMFGKFGVIEEGVYVDIFLIDGNLLEDFFVVGIGD